MKRRQEQPKITLDTKVQRDPKQEFSAIDNEVVMLSLKNGEYYYLNPVASKIWELIKEPQKINILIDVLSDEYIVKKDVCRQDVLECINDFSSKGLIIIYDKQNNLQYTASN